MSKPRKIKQLEELARTMVGDGKAPNLYFITVDVVVVTITRDLSIAKSEWRRNIYNHPFTPCSVEDRKQGTVCQHDKDEETCRWITIDDSNLLS